MRAVRTGTEQRAHYCTLTSRMLWTNSTGNMARTRDELNPDRSKQVSARSPLTNLLINLSFCRIALKMLSFTENCRLHGMFVTLCIMLQDHFKWTEAAVLNSSPRVPPICILYKFLLSLQTLVVFDCKYRIFHHDSSSNQINLFHSKGNEVWETWI